VVHEVTTTIIPATISQLCDWLADCTDVDPVLTQTRSGHWTIEVSNDRVHLESRHNSRGKGIGATITVDGTEYPFKYSQYEFMDIWRRPEVIHGALVTVPEPGQNHMPAIVQHMLGVMRARTTLLVTAGFDGDRWILGIGDDDDATGIRMFMIEEHKRWVMAYCRPIQVIREGEDLSDECGGSLSHALRLMLAGGGDTGESGISSVSGAAAKSNNAVRVRRQTVIRT
jgi:hypothetical protein